MKKAAPALALYLLACGPNVGMESAGAGGDAGVEDDEVELDEVERASWALGFFHYAAYEPGTRARSIQMYELREDGTGIQHVEVCDETAPDDWVFEPFRWRLIDDDTIELFTSDGEKVDWVRGPRDVIELKRLGDGHVYQQLNGANRVEYVRGKLCVIEHLEIRTREECNNVGFLVDLCEEQ